MRAALLVSCLILLAGCVNMQKLRATNPTPDDFPGALAAEYLAYADSESEQYHWINAEHYAGKGLKAQRGEAVKPETPDDDLPTEQLADLTQARARLTEVLNDHIKAAMPQKLARAQLLYDCWQHQAGRGMSTEKVPCAEEFRSTLDELEEVNDTFLYSKPIDHSIVFTSGSDKLSAKALTVIRRVAGEIRKARDYVVLTTAHPGADAPAHALADKRLAAVRDALVKARVNGAHIRLSKEEETRKVHLSGDESPQPTGEVDVTVKIRRSPGKGGA